MKIAALVYIGSRVEDRDHRPRNKVPVASERYGKDRLKQQVHYVAFRLVQPEGVLLKRQGPDCRNRVGQLLVNLRQRSLTIARFCNFGVYFLLETPCWDVAWRRSLRRRWRWLIRGRLCDCVGRAANDEQRDD